MRNHDFVKGFIAGGAVAARRIVKFGTSDVSVVQAAAAADSVVGVSELAGNSGESVSVIMGGIAAVEYGGNVTRGALLTADTNGRAVTSAPAAGVNNRIIGIAMISGVSGDIGSVLINPGAFQGAGLA